MMSVFCLKSTQWAGAVGGPAVGTERWVCGVDGTVFSIFVWIYNTMFTEKEKSYCDFACHSVNS